MTGRMRKLTLFAAVALVALSGATPPSAHAGALAQSILDITSATVTVAPGGGVVTFTNVANSGDVQANFNGALAANTAFPTPGPVNLSVCQGPDCAAYAPGTELLPPPVNSFSGSTAQLNGVLTAPGGAAALTDNTVSLEDPGNGTAQSRLGLVATFTINVTGLPATLTFDFDADGHLVAAIDTGQTGSAVAQMAWSLTLDGGVWAPNGVLGDATGAITETQDPCSINRNVGALGAGPQASIFDCQGHFQATATLAPGNYTVTITHSGNAAASTALVPTVPVPSSLLVLGAGLLAAGWLNRRFARLI